MSVTTAPRVEPLAFDALRGFHPLFLDYCMHFDRVAVYYAGPFRDPETRMEVARAVRSFPRNRNALVDAIYRQYTNWTLDASTREHLEALRKPETLAMVTGQQIGLFGGPLYTLYKTLTTLVQARELSERTGQPVVPVFWLEDEDHDFDEIASITLLHAHEPVTLTYRPADLPENPGPVGRLRITPAVEEIFAELERYFPGASTTWLEALRAAYQPGMTLRDAFVRWMQHLLPDTGIIFLSPDDPSIKRLCLPLFRRVLEEEEALYSRLHASSEAVALKYPLQVRPRKGFFFLMDADGRHALTPEEGTYRLKGIDRRLSREDVLRLLEEHPERFSPNVILRPLMQDYLLPTWHYVAGPSEIAYFAQFKGLYEHLGIPMPLLFPRLSATVVEPAIRRILEKYDLDVTDLQEDVDALFQHLILVRYAGDLEPLFGRVTSEIDRSLDTLLPFLSSLDPSLIPTAEATRTRVMKEIDRLRGKALRARKRQHEQLYEHLRRAQQHLFPYRKLQERILSPLYFLESVGTDFPRRVQQCLPVDTCMHQVIYP